MKTVILTGLIQAIDDTPTGQKIFHIITGPPVILGEPPREQIAEQITRVYVIQDLLEDKELSVGDKVCITGKEELINALLPFQKEAARTVNKLLKEKAPQLLADAEFIEAFKKTQATLRNRVIAYSICLEE